jgi:hypothetical protein
MPLDSPFFLKQGEKDGRILILAALSTVLRRDMSLNRRLYNWMLLKGTQEELSKECQQRIGSAIIHSLQSNSMSVEKYSKMLHCLLGLMDKDEIGPHILSFVFIPLFIRLQAFILSVDDTVEKEMRTTLFGIAQTLLNRMEPFEIWSVLQNFDHQETVCSLTEFLLNHFQWEDEETQNIHLPFLMEWTLEALIMEQLGQNVALKSLLGILKSMKPLKLLTSQDNLNALGIHLMGRDKFTSDRSPVSRKTFYAPGPSANPLISSDWTTMSLKYGRPLLAQIFSISFLPWWAENLALYTAQSQALEKKNWTFTFKLCCQVLSEFSKLLDENDFDNCKAVIESCSSNIIESQSQFEVLEALIKVFISFPASLSADDFLEKQIPVIFPKLWVSLDPLQSPLHSRVTSLIWELSHCVGNGFSLENEMMRLLVEKKGRKTVKERVNDLERLYTFIQLSHLKGNFSLFTEEIKY